MKKEAPPAAPKKGRPGYMPGDPQGEGPGLNDHRKHDEEYRKNAMFVSHMAQVVDATPVEKQRKREIADVLEVLYAILDTKKSSIEEAEKIRLSKKEKRGAFEKRIFLENVEE